ncbi:MAG: matrixin family metalloprotease [Phycisphaerales bacterium]|nr:matrixin family metalloprotease [Phycisphaerales bacterium]
MTSMVVGCGNDVLGRLIGQDDPAASRPIDVRNWDEASKSELPTEDGPFGETSVLDVADHEGFRVDMSIDAPDDVQIYSIGEIVPGERIAIQAIPLNSSRLDPVVAVFDANMNWIDYNDDRHYYDRLIDSFLDFKVRNHSEECFVAVASSPRAESVGELNLYVSRELATPPTPPKEQIIYLHFGGQNNVVIGRRAPVNVPRFNAAAIDPSLESYTQTFIEGVTNRVREDYARFGVTVLSSQTDARPVGSHTTIYFGSEDPGLLGLSDSIDTYNQYDNQDAIIYVESFDLFMAATPTTQQWIDVLANVASHEVGHLIGLHHTTDPTEIMDTSADMLQMLEPQTFHRAPIHDGTFSIGYQDSVGTLLTNVGPSAWYDPDADSQPSQPIGQSNRVRQSESGIPARSLCAFGTACESVTLQQKRANVQN